MLKIKKIDHVAVCVPNIDQALVGWKALFDLCPGAPEWVEAQKTEAVLVQLGDASLELVAPHGNAGLERFLEKRGPGLHHIALEVESVEEAIAALVAMGVPMIDRTPRPGARGHKVAFVHPKAAGGVLVELVDSGRARDPHS